ncbi:hypothetical protein [Nocardia colli]|uniref:hypothetical protein n=1 Tax=Nocardia colli TaxID=2545717 RepID=UPI0035DE1F08
MMLGVAPAYAAELPEGCEGAMTEGDDTITCTKDLQKGAVIDALGGDDTIVIKGDVLEGAFVRGGAGNDKITAYNVGRFVCPSTRKPGIGADDLEGGTLDGGAGADEITVGGQDLPGECTKVLTRISQGGNVGRHAFVLGGAGDDVITVGSNGYVYQEDLDNKESASIAHGGHIGGGEGADSITVGLVSLGEGPPSPDYEDRPDGTYDGVYGGPGGDKISVALVYGVGEIYGDNYEPKKGPSIPGAGSDTIDIKEMVGGNVFAGPGDDTVTGGNIGGTAKIWGDTGNDTITAEALGLASGISGDDGDDTLTATLVNTDGDTHNGYVIGGNGDDTIKVTTLGSDSSVVRGDGRAGSTSPDDGKGKDTITVGTNNGGVFGGQDDDNIKIETNNYYVDGGEGAPDAKGDTKPDDNDHDTCVITETGPKPNPGLKVLNCEKT